MVAWDGGHFEMVVKGHRGANQGAPIYPMIFYVVVDAVIRHWISVVADKEAVLEGFGRAVQHLAK